MKSLDLFFATNRLMLPVSYRSCNANDSSHLDIWISSPYALCQIGRMNHHVVWRKPKIEEVLVRQRNAVSWLFQPHNMFEFPSSRSFSSLDQLRRSFCSIKVMISSMQLAFYLFSSRRSISTLVSRSKTVPVCHGESIVQRTYNNLASCLTCRTPAHFPPTFCSGLLSM